MSNRRLTRLTATLVLAGAMAGSSAGVALADSYAKTPPSGSGAVSVTGHTVRMAPSSHRSANARDKKPAVPGSVSVDGHTVHATPSGA